MSEEDWNVSEWECFEKEVASVNNEALKQKMTLEEDAINMVNDMFDKPNPKPVSNNDVKLVAKTKLKPSRPDTGRSRPSSGRQLKHLNKQTQKQKIKPIFTDEDEDAELDYCCDITDRILSRCN